MDSLPWWVYEKPRNEVYPERYTPQSGKFRDAAWVEPRGYTSNGVELTYSISLGGGIKFFNTTPAHFFNDEHYIKWTPNPQRATLWRRLFTKHQYWIPTTQ